MGETFPAARRAALAVEIMRLLDAWGVGPEDRIALLGLPPATRPRMLTRYRNGTPLPDEPELMQRIHKLGAIQDALEKAFPHNAALCNAWITTANAHFDGRAPLAIMIEEGLAGIEQVVRHLDGSAALY